MRLEELQDELDNDLIIDNAIIVTVQFSIVDDPDTLERIRIQMRSNAKSGGRV